MERQIFNLHIIRLLEEIVNTFPELRFTQILSMLELDKDRFYEEPQQTYISIVKKLEDIKETNSNY